MKWMHVILGYRNIITKLIKRFTFYDTRDVMTRLLSSLLLIQRFGDAHATIIIRVFHFLLTLEKHGLK